MEIAGRTRPKGRQGATFSARLTLGKPCSYQVSQCRLERTGAEVGAAVQQSSGSRSSLVGSADPLHPGSVALRSQRRCVSEQRWLPSGARAAGRLQPLAPASSPDRQTVWKAPCQGSCWHRGSAPTWEDFVTNAFVILMLLALTALSCFSLGHICLLRREQAETERVVSMLRGEKWKAALQTFSLVS